METYAAVIHDRSMSQGYAFDVGVIYQFGRFDSLSRAEEWFREVDGADRDFIHLARLKPGGYQAYRGDVVRWVDPQTVELL